MIYLIAKFFQKCNKTKCTCFPDKILKYDLSQCCENHDKNYKQQNKTRYQSDKQFYNCLKQKTNKSISIICFIGVRTFGWIWWLKSKEENIK